MQPTAAAPRRDRIRAALRVRPASAAGIATALTALALTLTSWPLATLEPGVGIDPAWMTGLNMAAWQGLDFGPDALFTYGPLGFLRAGTVYAFPWTTRLSFAYTFIVQLALCLTLLWALRRSFGSLLLAAPIALVIATLIYQEPVPVVVFIVVVGLLRGELPGRLVPLVLGATGMLVGVQLLAKLNTGVVVVALCAIALGAVTDRRRAAVAWFAGGMALALAAGWVLGGQRLDAIPDYFGGSLQIISGYSDSMGLEDPGRGWELWAALALTVIGLAVIHRCGPAGPRRARIAMTAMWLVLAFTAFKSGFVRHDGGHVNIFFATMLGGLAGLPLVRLPRATAGLVLAFAAMALLASARVAPPDIVKPLQRAGRFLDQSRIIADGSAVNRGIVAAREKLTRAFALDPRSYAALRGHTVHIEPNEMNVAWAYRLAWKPLPVFQSYSAYTADLDERNAAAFSSPRGPERVLRHDVGAIDGRNPAWESPAATRAMLCSFREAVTVGPWQVLSRVANRCGPARLLRETRARYGESIAVAPAPGKRSMVYAEIDGVVVGGFERLVAAAYKPAERFLTLDGDRIFHLMPGTAADGLIMRVPRAADFSGPFHLDQGAQRLVVTRAGAEQPDDELRVRFFAVDVR